MVEPLVIAATLRKHSKCLYLNLKEASEEERRIFAAALSETDCRCNTVLTKKLKGSQAVDEVPATILVPTFPDKKDEEELDLQSLTEEDLKLLKKTDPFLYYSIPGVNKAALSLKKVDHSKASQSTKVTRKARLSFECHPSLAMDELLVGWKRLTW
ncbi:hypothetical protein QTG54_002880 [Skeletonema marinoi]|uniref:Uncharacterized protein n=1 Tax=Skeletonema marinoi TaxID=267567 RepID=A0AAD8YHA1_9STRA|nr:hypothetical protein QTG54_002880 [Skeletonema marinoi]